MISILLTTYNSSRYILDTLKSINNQTFKNWELIVIDDCSNDNTVRIIKKFFLNKKKILIIRNNKNSGGPAYPRNIGIEKARRKFLAFIDDDDIWHPRKLEIQYKLMLIRKYDLVSTSKYNFKNIREINNDINYKNLSYRMIKEINFTLLLQRNIIPLSSILVKKKIVLKFNQEKNFHGVEDYLFLLNLLHNKIKVCKILKNLVFYRIGKNNLFSSSKLNMSIGVIRVLWNMKINKKISFLCFFKSVFFNFYRRLIFNE